MSEYYLSSFEASVQEIDERTAKGHIFTEYKSYGDTSSTLFECIVYKNADGFAVIESDINDANDTLDVYLLNPQTDDPNSREHKLEEVLECDLDVLSPKDLAEAIVYLRLLEMLEDADDELADAIKNSEIYRR